MTLLCVQPLLGEVLQFFNLNYKELLPSFLNNKINDYFCFFTSIDLVRPLYQTAIDILSNHLLDSDTYSPLPPVLPHMYQIMIGH
jgi:hypothetical protein